MEYDNQLEDLERRLRMMINDYCNYLSTSNMLDNFSTLILGNEVNMLDFWKPEPPKQNYKRIWI